MIFFVRMKRLGSAFGEAYSLYSYTISVFLQSRCYTSFALNLPYGQKIKTAYSFVHFYAWVIELLTMSREKTSIGVKLG